MHMDIEEFYNIDCDNVFFIEKLFILACIFAPKRLCSFVFIIWWNHACKTHNIDSEV